MARPASPWAVNTCESLLLFSPLESKLSGPGISARQTSNPIAPRPYADHGAHTGSISATSTRSSPPASSTGASTAFSRTPSPSWTTPRRARTSSRPTTPRMSPSVAPVGGSGGRVWSVSSLRSKGFSPHDGRRSRHDPGLERCYGSVSSLVCPVVVRPWNERPGCPASSGRISCFPCLLECRFSVGRRGTRRQCSRPLFAQFPAVSCIQCPTA